LVDQSLGRIAVPAFFKSEGFEVTTIMELFGHANVPDVEWICRAGELDAVVAHKDKRIRYRPAEQKAVQEARLRMLCLTGGNMTAQDQVECFRANLQAIEQWWAKPGPWILAVRRSGVVELPLGMPAGKGARS